MQFFLAEVPLESLNVGFLRLLLLRPHPEIDRLICLEWLFDASHRAQVLNYFNPRLIDTNELLLPLSLICVLL